MTDLIDLFPGFASHWIDTDAGKIFARSGGSGPPLLLLHGFPQTHVMWHKVAAGLAEKFSVVAMDLRGYGWSAAPRSHNGALYSKREMGEDVVAVMEELGHVRFHLAGHDRGGRVAYRLALDHPEVVTRLIPIDILPTVEVWDALRWKNAIGSYHWAFLAQPSPMPETLIAADPAYYVSHTIASWTADKTLGAISPEALQHYRAALRAPERIHAVCEDYRAGATFDYLADDADRKAGRRITCPTLFLWGSEYIGKSAASPVDVWRRWAPDLTFAEIKSGHFLAEENPADTIAALVPFITSEIRA